MWFYVLLLFPFASMAHNLEGGCELKVAVPTTLQNVEPIAAKNWWEKRVSVLQYDTLIKIGRNGALEPWLAKEWLISRDGKSIEMEIRKGIKFLNGDNLSANEVVSSLNRWRTDKLSIDLARLSSIVSVSAVDEFRIRIQLKRPFYPLILYFATPRSAIYKKQGDKPFGTGAWEILSSDQDIVRFKRNPNYFLGSPKCENLHLIKIPQDEELAAIQSKKVDFVDYFSPELKKSEFLKAPIFPKELNVISVPTYDVMLLFFTNGTSHSLSPSERQWIFQKLIGNKSFNINSSVNFACNILPKGIGFNSIDFCRMDFRSKPNSIRPKSDLALYGPNDQRNVFMTMIADRLAQFRINTSTIGLPINEIFKLHKEKKIALHIETVTMQVPDPYGLLSMYESGSPENFSNYNNPKFDRVLNQATESLSKEVRVRLYDQAIKILARDFMIIPLVNQSRYVVANSKVKGLSAQSMGPYYSNYHSLYKLVN